MRVQARTATPRAPRRECRQLGTRHSGNALGMRMGMHLPRFSADLNLIPISVAIALRRKCNPLSTPPRRVARVRGSWLLPMMSALEELVPRRRRRDVCVLVPRTRGRSVQCERVGQGRCRTGCWAGLGRYAEVLLSDGRGGGRYGFSWGGRNVGVGLKAVDGGG